VATYETRSGWQGAQGAAWVTKMTLDWSGNAAYDFGPDGTGDGPAGIGDGLHTVAGEAELLVDTNYDRRAGLDPTTFAVVNGTGLQFVAGGASDYAEVNRQMDDVITDHVTQDVVWYGAHFDSANMAAGMTSAKYGIFVSWNNADNTYTGWASIRVMEVAGNMRVQFCNYNGTDVADEALAVTEVQLGLLIYRNNVSAYWGTGTSVPLSHTDTGMAAIVPIATGFYSSNLWNNGHDVPTATEEVVSSNTRIGVYFDQGSTSGTLLDAHCKGEIVRRLGS
jgi:hypothetical protein